MRPWRVGRAMKPHDYTSWLRGLTTVHPCTDAKLARIHSGHPVGLLSASSPPRIGMQVKGTQRCCVVRRVAADVVDVAFDPPARFLSARAGRISRLRTARGIAWLRLRHRMCLQPNPAGTCVPAQLHRAGDRSSGRIFGPRFSARRKVGRSPAGERNALPVWRQPTRDDRQVKAQQTASRWRWRPTR